MCERQTPRLGLLRPGTQSADIHPSNSKFTTGLQESSSARTVRVLQTLDTTAVVSLPGGQRQAPCDGPMHEDGSVIAFLISVSGGVLTP